MRCQILPLILLSGGLAFGMVACDGDEPGTGCNHDGVCDAEENSANCSDDCPVCNHDGVCDVAGGENPANCIDDCSGHCDLVPMTGTGYDFIVQTVYYPDTVEAAKDNGIDIDGDGTIDNKLGEILQFLTYDSTEPRPRSGVTRTSTGCFCPTWTATEMASLTFWVSGTGWSPPCPSPSSSRRRTLTKSIPGDQCQAELGPPDTSNPSACRLRS